MECFSLIAPHIIDLLKKPVGRHFGYLFCYKNKIQELESETEKLKDEKTRIRGRVDRAKDCAQIIDADVSKWLTEVQNVEVEVGKFLEDKVNENKEFFKCWCPDLTWRYRLGKGAEKKKETVSNLKKEGRKFEIETLPVGHTAPYPEELQFTSSGDYMNFKSRASVFNKIIGALKDSEVNLIGVHGPGGAGKTTMVEEAAKQAKKDGLFDETVMAVVSKNANVRKIQKELASKLNLTFKEDNEVGRRGELWNRLKKGNKKILVIMDDVWQQLDMKEIGIPIANGGRGCKVLLTTRREGVCQKMEVQRDFPIGVLEEQESWSLFKKVVGNVPSEVAQSKAEEVCKECGGLPVAIVAVGAALKGKAGHVWDDALNQLKNSSLQEIPDIDPKMYTSLKWSYDYLEHEDAKSCFLLCCLFPEDADIPLEDLVRHCMALRLLRHAETLEKARSRVQAMVDLLRSSCLLLHGEDENYVKMHDVIRDVAVSITKGKQEGQQWPHKQQFLVKHGVQKWPEEGTWEHYTAVSIMSNDMDELPGDLQCPELHSLLLQCPRKYLVDDEIGAVLPDPFFNGMTKLTVLRLEGVMLSLLPSFTNMVNLRMLQTSDCHLRDIGIIKNLKKKLEILILGASNIEELPLEIGDLTHLRLLDLRQCDSLEVIPQGVISRLSDMEELYISQEFDQWEGSTTFNKEKSNVSLSELNSLKRLTTLYIHIPDVTLLPNDFPFEKLIRFQISVGETFHSFGRDSSRMLKLEGFRLKAEFDVLINRAEELCFREMEGLETLFHETRYEGSSNLKYLEVSKCHDLEYSPGKSKLLFSKLTKVVIKNCSRLKYLWSSLCAKGLLQLQQLHVSNCANMEGIVEIGKEIDEEESENMVIDFSQLREMRLIELPKLISFFPETEMTIKENPLFNEKVVFPALEALYIEALQNTNIWDKKKLATSFCQLKDLTVERCEKAVNVIPSNMICRLQNLQSISIRRCNSLIYLVEELKTEEISTIVTVNGELPCLRNLEQLQELHVSYCANMEGIVEIEKERDEEDPKDTMIDFSQLREMSLVGLPKLISFCPKTEKTIKENSCTEEQSLFNEKVVFPALEELHIEALQNTNIWDKQKVASSFCQLKDLTVRRCEKAVNVIPSNMICWLQNLQNLSISKCNSVISLVEELKTEEISEIATVNDEGKEVEEDYVIKFPQLSLVLKDLPNLKSFKASKFEAQSLFNHQVVFPKLKRISAVSLASLREIHLPPVMTSVEGSLEEVRLGRFDQITLVSSPHLMQRSLHKLVLTNCRLRVTQPFDLDGPNGEEGQVEPRIEVDLLILNCLSESACFWEKDPLVALALHNLKFLEVRNCPLLRNLFTNSVASSLNQLLSLVVSSCELMEEVVTNKGEDEAIDEVNIEFPKLSFLELDNLSNLESFCSANYNFNFPSLKSISLLECPKMQTFTSGQARLPQKGISCAKEWNRYFRIGDLNKYLRGEETATTPDDYDRVLEELAQDMGNDFDEFFFETWGYLRIFQ